MLNIILSLLIGLALGIIYGLLLLRFSLKSRKKAHFLTYILASTMRLLLLSGLFYIVIKFTSLNFITLSIGFLASFTISTYIYVNKIL